MNLRTYGWTAICAGMLVLAGCDDDIDGEVVMRETRSNAPVAKAAAATTESAPKAPNEFDQMIVVCKLDGAQLEEFKARVAARDAAYDALENDKNARKREELKAKIEAAKKANEKAEKIAELQSKLEPLVKEHWDARKALRANVMGVLTFNQLREWAGAQLLGRVQQNFKRVEMTDAQLSQARALCAELASANLRSDAVTADPYLTALSPLRSKAVEEITAKVLTDAQRAKLKPAEAKPAEAKAAEPKPADAKPAEAKKADSKKADPKKADPKKAEPQAKLTPAEGAKK